MTDEELAGLVRRIHQEPAELERVLNASLPTLLGPLMVTSRREQSGTGFYWHK